MMKTVKIAAAAICMAICVAACGQNGEHMDIASEAADYIFGSKEIEKDASGEDREEEYAEGGGSAQEEEEVPDMSYKFALIDERHDPDALYETEIWCVLETPPGFSLDGQVRILYDGEPLDNNDAEQQVFHGYVCVDEKYDGPGWTQEDNRRKSSEMITIRVMHKEEVFFDELSFIVSERYEKAEGPSAPVEYELYENAGLGDISINNSRYLYGETLFRLSDETLLVMDGTSTGTAGGHAGAIGPEYGKESDDTQCLYQYNEAVLIEGSPERVKELIEWYSYIYYLDGYGMGSDTPYYEIAEPEDEDTRMFVTANSDYTDMAPEYIYLKYGYIKEHCGSCNDIDISPLYGSNIVYDGPDGYELWFMYR